MMLGVAQPNALRFPIPAQVEPLRSFVTQTAYRGNDLGGVAGADAACKTSAARGSIKGNFKAYLSAMGEGPNMRFDAPEAHRYITIQRARCEHATGMKPWIADAKTRRQLPHRAVGDGADPIVDDARSVVVDDA